MIKQLDLDAFSNEKLPIKIKDKTFFMTLPSVETMMNVDRIRKEWNKKRGTKTVSLEERYAFEKIEVLEILKQDNKGITEKDIDGMKLAVLEKIVSQYNELVQASFLGKGLGEVLETKTTKMTQAQDISDGEDQ